MGPRREWKSNQFLLNIFRIAQEEGYNPHEIVPLFKSYSSIDFIYGPQSVQKRMDNNDSSIPQRIWNRVGDHYNVFLQRPFRVQSNESMYNEPVYFKEKSDVFIGSKVTEYLVQRHLILEHFPTARRLYQYLHWTMRISKVAQTMTILEGHNGCNTSKVMLFDIELHDHRGQRLYALCTPNDVVMAKVQPWQLVGLLAASELTTALGVDSRALPRGVKATSSQFAYYRDLMATSNLKAQKVKLRQWDARRKPIRYAHLRCIETGRSKGNKESKVMTVSLSTFYESVRVAMMDDSIQLIPLVSIISKKIPLRRGKKVKAEDFRYCLYRFMVSVWSIFSSESHD